MHFTKQSAFLTNIPSIYEPYDLQHLHLPQFFTPLQSLDREVQYRTFCQQACLVAAMTNWVKQDLIKQYALPPEKVVVVPRAPVLAAYPTPTQDDMLKIQQKFSLPESFIFYPAQTWAHKNHLNLLKALAILRDQFGLIVPLVLSGKQNEFFPKIENRIYQLQLAQQVQFLGFVTPLELQSLYQLSRAMIFPSKFEGGGLPLAEAFLVGTPVACSNATSLPDLAGNATLLFNPDQPLEMAAAIHRLWVDRFLREELITRGKKYVARFSWEKTARMFRAYYRQLANRPLTDEDHNLAKTKG
jgi:glycosyltransferase involved in cell wall biosynthesis